MTQEHISRDYLDMQTKLHDNPNYGVASISFAPLVAQVMKQTGAKSLSDYGAGKCNLLKALQQAGQAPTEYFPFDPVFPHYGPPRAADLVCCIDVLEHVEEEHIDGVLTDLRKITTKLGFFSIHMGPAGKTLADGRNAHITQKPTSWWLPKLCSHFEVKQLQLHQMHGPGFWIIVSRREI